MQLLNETELDNRIHKFLERKSEKFPEMHLLDAGDVIDRPARGRSALDWFKATPGNI